MRPSFHRSDAFDQLHVSDEFDQLDMSDAFDELHKFDTIDRVDKPKKTEGFKDFIVELSDC